MKLPEARLTLSQERVCACRRLRVCTCVRPSHIYTRVRTEYMCVRVFDKKDVYSISHFSPQNNFVLLSSITRLGMKIERISAWGAPPSAFGHYYFFYIITENPICVWSWPLLLCKWIFIFALLHKRGIKFLSENIFINNIYKYNIIDEGTCIRIF